MTTIKGLKTVSASTKLIFEIPATDRVVSFPEEVELSEHGQNNDYPAVVTCNHTHPGRPWQGADSVEGVIIMNEVPGEVAEQLLDMVDGTVEALDAIIVRAQEMGVGDIYTTTRSFVDAKVTPAGRMIGTYTGIVKRDDRDICTVYKNSDDVHFVCVPGADGPCRIETDILLRTYMNPDGSPINLTDVPVVL